MLIGSEQDDLFPERPNERSRGMMQTDPQNRIMTWRSIDAVRVTAMVFGVYAGLLGIEHGYFETLQGNVVPTTLKIMAVSGPGLPFPFGHEPAMTLVPNFLVTGILAILVGLSIILWSALFIQKKHGAVVLSLLSILLLLVGGGFGPITLLITACIGAGRINKPLTWWRKNLPAGPRSLLATLWPWSLAAALGWVPIEVILGQIFHLKNDHSQTLTNLNFLFSYPLLAFIILALCTGLAHKAQRQSRLVTE
jgi:hypothetical protein